MRKENGNTNKPLKDMADAAIKGITDGSKEMVKQTKDLLAAGMSPQEAMAKYVSMTNEAYQLLSNDTLVNKLPDTIREGKQVLSEAYKDILDTLDSQFIGGTNAKLKQAGNLFKQGFADGIDAGPGIDDPRFNPGQDIASHQSSAYPAARIGAGAAQHPFARQSAGYSQVGPDTGTIAREFQLLAGRHSNGLPHRNGGVRLGAGQGDEHVPENEQRGPLQQ